MLALGESVGKRERAGIMEAGAVMMERVRLRRFAAVDYRFHDAGVRPGENVNRERGPFEFKGRFRARLRRAKARDSGERTAERAGNLRPVGRNDFKSAFQIKAVESAERAARVRKSVERLRRFVRRAQLRRP